MDLECPRCKRTLRPAVYEMVSINYCAGCSGQWLNGSQLRSIVDTRERKFTQSERETLEKKQKHFTPDTLKQESPLECPEGHGEMVKYRYAGDSPVVLDRCEACDGTWLDGGELEQVQILAEGWEKELGPDLEMLGAKLKFVENAADEKLSSGAEDIRSPLVKGLVMGILRLWR